MAKLSAIAAVRKNTELEIDGIEFQITEAGDKVAVLTLKNAIEKVTGSQVIADEFNNPIKVQAFDVTEVKVRPENSDDDGFDLDEKTGKGTYKGDLRLDVAKRSGDVWLTAKSFALAGREMRNDNQKKRQSGLVAKLLANAAPSAAGKIANTPAPSVGEKLQENTI